MSYAELDKASSNLGAYLSNQGIGPDMVIPICFEKSRWTIVAMMGVLKAGAAFTTMDPAQPTNRLEDTILETKSNIVLASSSQGGRFELEGRQVIMDIPYICEKSDLPSYTSDSLNVQPTNLAYVAFTSGSTGKPKGVAHTHVSACASITLKNPNGREPGYGPGSRILQFASQAFAASVVEILKTIGSGGCICIPSENVRLNNITQFMREEGITRAFFTPSLLKLFTVDDLDFLKILLVGGEAVLPDLIQTWASRLRLIEAIGMTEGVAITTEIEPGREVKRINQTSSGLPWIVDVNDVNKLVPVGAIGELLVEGPCLAKEYLGDPGNTDASFIIAPSWANRCKDPSRKFRLYRTGDLARYFNDGVVRIMGRKDNRVK